MRDETDNITEIEQRKEKETKLKITRMFSYQHYFEGYTEFRETKPNGKKKKIKRIYTDDYIRQDVTDRVWLTYKIVEPILFFFAAAIFICSSAIAYTQEQVFYIVIPGLLSAFFYVMCLMPVCFRTAAPRNFTKWDYESGPKRVEWYSCITAILHGITAIGTLVYLGISGIRTVGAILSFFGYCVSGGLMLALFLMEKRTAYRTEENDTPVPSEGYETDFL